MCGIAGIVHLDGGSVERERVARMNVAQRHRGPDGEGVWSGDGVALGHRRLTIIDLSEQAGQPMISPDGRFVITYNGEVYNYRELRAELEAGGRRFRTASDTEVVLAAYETWGADAVSRFNGMWALAIWDTVERTLFCSRDRFGIKPLYYAVEGRTLVFSSEMKAILAVLPEANRPHPGYLHAFVATGLFGETDETFFSAIRALPPAHSMLVRRGEIAVRRYWRVDPETWRARLGEAPPAEVLRALFTQAVRFRLRSDVPVGTCLSGGLDSSSIVAVASGMRETAMSTFSSIYDERDCDEREYIEEMQRAFPLDPHWVHPDGRELPEVLERMIEHQDIPAAAPGIFSQWNVMRTAHGRVKVLLDGQGGDELLGGYFPYFAPYLRGIADLARARGLGSTRERLRREYPEIFALTGQEYERGLGRLLRRAARSWLLGPPRRRVTPWHAPEEASIDPEFAAQARAMPAHREHSPTWYADPLNQDLADALVRTSIPGLLHYEDRSSMAFGIEARTPFLDVNLVEFVMALPFEEKIRGATTKALLRDGMAGVLPERVRLRRDKKGYPTPLAAWLRGPLRAYARDLLLGEESRRRKVLRPEVVERHLHEHLEGRADHSWLVWRWMTLEVWMRRFVDHPYEVEPQPRAAGSASSERSAR
jgi:asparagine synthase (glutamine-hydrolysing)